MAGGIPVSCNRDCGGGCALLAHVRDGRLERITDNPVRPPLATGCVRGYQMPRVVYAPERISRPLIRRGARGGGDFEEVSWGRALSAVLEGLDKVRLSHGTESMMLLGSSGSCRGALHNTGTLPPRFFTALCAQSSPPSTYCQPIGNFSSQASMHASASLFGTQLAGIDPATIRHSALILLWGANICDTRFGAQWESVIRERKRAGVPVVVIDPRRSRTAELLGTEWIPALPGSDSALMAAMLFVLLERGMVDREAVARYSVGFDAVEEYTRGRIDGVPKDPSWAEGVCGVPASRIRDLALLYARSRPAALIPGLSTQRAVGGEEACRWAVVLQLATGNAGRAGGSSGSPIWHRLPGPRCGRMGAVPRAARPVPAPLGVPVYEWADAVLLGQRGGYPADVRAIYNVGGNYVAQGSDVAKSRAAFGRVELAVCHELFLTPTARLCDVVLPVTTFLERDDIVFPDGNFLHYSHRAVAPQGEARDDYRIFAELADRMGFGQAFTEGRTEEQWLESFLADSEVPDAQELKRTGIYAGADQERIGLAAFFADPARSPLSTPSGRIELSSSRYAASGFPPYPTCRSAAGAPGDPPRPVTPPPPYYVNSQGSNIAWFSERQGATLAMHPADAARSGVRDGELVLLESPRGACRLRVRLTSGIMPGVVCLPVGRWPELGADGVEGNAAPNALTSTVPTLPSHGARTHSVAVRARPAQAPSDP